MRKTKDKKYVKVVDKINVKTVVALCSNLKIKGKTAGNIIKESIRHPLRTSIIDTSSGDVIEKKETQI